MTSRKRIIKYIFIFSPVIFTFGILWFFVNAERQGRSKKWDGLVILCAGDSLTAESYPNWLQKMFFEDELNVVVTNRGVKGNTSGEYSIYIKRHKILQETNPDIILLQLGTNDVRTDADHTPTNQFIKNMNQIIKQMKLYQNTRGKKPIILIATVPPIFKTIFPNFNKESMRRIKEEINPAIEKLAKKWNLILVDNYKLFLNRPDLIPDIHPIAAGYKAMAKNWYKSLISLN